MEDFTPDEFLLVLDEYNAMQRSEPDNGVKAVSAEDF